MEFSKLLIALFTFQAALLPLPSVLGRNIRKPGFPVPANSKKSNVFRTYIGSSFKNVAFSDVPINSDIETHFILSFAIDYTTTSSPSPTNGKFNIFWDSDTLSPDEVIAIKNKHKNVKVLVSIGGDSVEKENVYFNPTSVDSWVSNAVSSLTKIIKDYNLDGIDIDYEHYQAKPNTFAECIGQLVSQLKRNGVVSIASIAPYDDPDVQEHYQELWKRYGNQFDYVNFQFYAYDKGTTVSQFLDYFEEQSENYKGGNIIASFATDGESGGLSPESGFFDACKTLKSKGKLAGIFVWSADDSKDAGFTYEKQSQALLASSHRKRKVDI